MVINKMKRILSLITIMLIASVASFATEQDTSQIVYEKGKRNWFIEAGVNANIYMGQIDAQLDFIDRIGWGGSFNFGKWFTPCVGFKFELNASEYFGAAYNNEEANFIQTHKYWNRLHNDENVDNYQYQHFVTFNPNISVMISLLNSLGKAKESRVYDMILTLGGGVYVNNGANVEEELNRGGERIILSPAFNVGLQNKFRLSEQVDFNIDLRAGYLSNAFDGQDIFGRGDLTASAGISLTYKFKPRGYAKAKIVEDRSAELENYQTLCANLSALNDSLEQVNAQLKENNRDLTTRLSSQQPQVEYKYIERENNTRIIAILEYKIGVSELTKENRAKLKAAAEIIKANPKYTFEVCGYADNETGSKEINIRLRNARANRAIDQLLHYGVNRNQIFKATNDGELPGTTTRAIVIRQLDCD